MIFKNSASNILKAFLYNQFYLFSSVIFALLVIIIMWIVTGVHTFIEVEQYITTVYYIKNVSDVFYIHRLLRPLELLFVLPFSYLVDIKTAFGIVNSILIVLSAVVMYLLSNHLLNNEKLAFYSTVLFSTSFPVICFGFGVLTEIGAWFFYLLVIYLTIRLFGTNSNLKHAGIIGLICGVGVLMKENVAAGVPFFMLMLLLSKSKKSDSSNKIKKIVTYGSCFLAPFLLLILINQGIMWHYFSYTYYDWFISNEQGFSRPNLFRYLFLMGGAFGLSLLFGLFGLIWYLKKDGEDMNRWFNKLSILSCIFISSSIVIFVWPAAEIRSMFLYFPIIFPLSAYAIAHISSIIKIKKGKHNSPKIIEFILLGANVISTILIYIIFMITHPYPLYHLI